MLSKQLNNIHPYAYVGLNPMSTNPNYIIDIVCSFFKVNKEDVVSHCRKRIFVVPRQIIMYFLKEYTKLTTTQIGQLIGGRDHSTVVTSYQTVEALYKNNKEYRKQLDLCRNSLLLEGLK